MDSFKREFNAWLAFYKASIIDAKTEKDSTFNQGIVEGLKLAEKLLIKHKVMKENDR